MYSNALEKGEIAMNTPKVFESEYRFCLILWEHEPITDFWRVGRGYAKRLAKCGLYTMGDIARCSLYNEDLLYKLFGVNAELLIDHAWGHEPCTISEIKSVFPTMVVIKISRTNDAKLILFILYKQ